MAGTVEGGRAASLTNKQKYGKDFYQKIGATGGSKSRGGGFTGDKKRARLLGALGGLKNTQTQMSKVDYLHKKQTILNKLELLNRQQEAENA